eukprot:4694053-Pyramimonas_sp.AAC.1
MVYMTCDGAHVHAAAFGGEDLNQTGRHAVSLVKDVASGLRAVRRGYDVTPVARDREVTARAEAARRREGPGGAGAARAS